jgi:hypothetical protein
MITDKGRWIFMCLWFRQGVFDASVERSRELLPGLMDMETWLIRKRGMGSA